MNRHPIHKYEYCNNKLVFVVNMRQLALYGGEPIRETPIPLSKPIIDQEEINNVTEVLKSGWIAQGTKVEELENRFAEYVGTDYAVAVSSGSTALHIALLAVGIKPRKEVIIPDITCISVPNAISYVRAVPRFVDIDMHTYNTSIDAMKKSTSSKTQAIIPIHLYGHAAKLDEILDFSKQKRLIVIENCAHAHGAEYKGKKVGSFGDIGIFSFYATKNMTTGEGGILVTNNSDIAKKARLLRDQDKSANFPILAYNYKMNDVEAAIGLAQLNKLDKLNEIRINNASFLSSHLNVLDGVKTPVVLNYAKHVFHRYTLFFESQKFGESRDLISRALEAEGIKNGVLYTPPAHRYPYYKKNYNFNDNQYQNAETISKCILSIPVHPNLGEKELYDIVATIRKVVQAFNK